MKIRDAITYVNEPLAGVEPPQLCEVERVRLLVHSVREHVLDVRGSAQCLVVHQEQHAVRTENETIEIYT